MQSPGTAPLVAIACGGTGGHLFPGLAVAHVLARRGCAVELAVSPREVDQQAVKTSVGMGIITLPAVGLDRRHPIAFLHGFWRSYRVVKRSFKARPPQAVLAMGGFTAAPPVLAGRTLGSATFLHESNSIPGRANRWLARWVDHIFAGFPSAAPRLRNRQVTVTGTPVRAQFRPADAATCRAALGLEPGLPTLLITGGSQGASGINDLVARSLPWLAERAPHLQFLHLTGPNDVKKISAAYSALGRRAVVHPYLTEMELALGAATVAISRAGASSLAEFAAMRLPVILIPYPAAADNHQFHNARALVETGAARMLVQKDANPELLAGMVLDLIENSSRRETLITALARWNKAGVTEQIADHILRVLMERGVRIPLGSGNSSESAQDSSNRSATEVQKLQLA